MLFMLIILVPYVVLATGYFVSLRAAFRSRSPSRMLFLPALLASLLLTIGLTAWGHMGIQRSISSTAAIGYLYLPYMALIGAFAFFFLALAAIVVGRFIAERAGWASRRLIPVPKLIYALILLFIAGWVTQHQVARSRLLDTAASEATDVATLESLIDQALATRDLDVLSKLARNPALPIPGLVRLHDSCQDTASDPHSPDYRIFHSLAVNPQTPVDILTALSASPFSSVRIAVVINPSTPVGVLTNLVNDEKSLVRAYLSDNPKLPKDLRRQLKEQEKKEQAAKTAESSSVPAETPAP